MKEIVISSSVLIAALFVLRLLFQKTISRRVQYALWALVLARLLIPVNMPPLSLSVLNAGQDAQAAVTRSLEREVYLLPISRTPAPESPPADLPSPEDPVVNAGDSFGYSILSQDGQTVTKYAQQVTIAEVLSWVWMAGVTIMAFFFLVSNVRFWRKLRKDRTPYVVEGCKRPVYLCKGLRSPCLFGLFRPAVYLTPTATETPARLRHVLVHEETHAQHCDQLWSLLRCLCLTIYWFNPLVWAAAAASRTDCELACDEGALRRLDQSERFSYGQTLLSLIPVRKGPGNPLLSATTMTSDKRRLKDRISRIAERRKNVVAAVCIVTALALVVSACTFTGAKASEIQTLTNAELTYFNEEFFNGKDYNIRNQFLSSLYDSPENIDLFELIYCGIPVHGNEYGVIPTEEEDRLVYGDDLPDCPRYKATSADLNALLIQYTGFTLENTKRIGLENLTYLSQYDAYYWAHGDTNYQPSIIFPVGEREGNLVRLYYSSYANVPYSVDTWNCVTLRAAEGGYTFVSNKSVETPKIPVALPESEPVLTIPLDGLPLFHPSEVKVVRHTNDCAERFDGWSLGNDQGIRAYRSTDGNTYAAVVYAEAAGRDDMLAWDMGCFLTLPDDGSYSASFFANLFGHDGLMISYSGTRSQGETVTVHDFYYVTDDSVPVLLARAYNAADIIDLNGDGQNELVSESQIFFQRNGQIFEADLPALLSDAWPEMTYWDSMCDIYARNLTINGFSSMPDRAEGNASFQLYFTDKNLLLYKGDAT